MGGLSRERNIILLVATATLCANGVSSIYYYSLPDDGHHLVLSATLYLHVATAMCVFGIIGVWREHVLSSSIFAIYMLSDALLTSVPRIFIPIMALNKAPELCVPPDNWSTTPRVFPETNDHLNGPQADRHSFAALHKTQELGQSYSSTTSLELSRRWLGEADTSSDCLHISTAIETTICVVVLSAAILQICGSTFIRSYAKKLRMKQRRDALLVNIGGDHQMADVEAAFSDEDGDLDGDNMIQLEGEIHPPRRV